MKLITKFLNYFKKEVRFEDAEPTEEILLRNLERCDISNDRSRLKIWIRRSEDEGYDFKDPRVMDLNIQSFINGYYQSLLYSKYKYFLIVKSISLTNGVVELSFKRGNGIYTYSYHIFDLQRLLKGCNKIIGGVNNEGLTYILKEWNKKKKEDIPNTDYSVKRTFLK